MFSPLRQLNRFFDEATEKTLSGSDQLVYLHLFNKFNRAHWTETILVRDAELLELCRLYDTNGKPSSINIIRNARARLKAKGFIDFTAGKGNNPTEYRLIPLHPVDTPVDTPIDTPVDTPVDTSANSYIHAREDVKTLRHIEEEARGSYGSDGLTAEETATLDALVDEWQDSPVFCKLDVKLISQLAALLKEHGAAAMRTAMEAARRTQKSGVNLAYFTRALKGGDKRDQSIAYEPVDTGWIYSPQAADA